MIGQTIPRWLTFVLGIVGVLVVGLLYEALSLRQTAINPQQTVVPSYRALALGAAETIKAQGTVESPKPSWLWEDFRATYWRLLLGVLSGVVLSLVVGMAIGCYSPVEALINPLITFLASVPPTAMLGVYMILFGTHLTAYVALVAFGIFFSMAQSIAQAVQTDVNSEHIDKAYTLGASEAEVIVEVVWRQILPRFIDNIRLHLGPAMIYLIAAEALFGSDGFGYRIKLQSRLVRMDVVFIYLAILGANGLLLNWLLLKLRRWLFPWFGG
jgi:NitT/TauT family transport system permease protein